MTIRPGPGAARPVVPAGLRGGIDPDDDLARFGGVSAWVFDLDNTLYPRTSEVFAQIEARIRSFIMAVLGAGPEEAERLQREYYVRYGATLRGLMIEHGVKPDAFLAYVHDIDHSALAPDPVLVDAIGRLPGRRFILTNGSRPHAERVIARVGLSGFFEDIFDIVWAEHLPKPAAAVYERLVRTTSVEPHRTALFEDLAKNLLVPQQLGMATVLVLPAGTRAMFKAEWDLEAARHPQAAEQPMIDFMTEDLGGFLQHVLAAIGR